MTTYVVTRKIDGEEVYRYSNDVPVEWSDMEFATHDHTAVPDAPVEPTTTVGPRRLTKLAFVGLLGDDFVPILEAAETDVGIRAFVKMLDWATPDPDGTSVDLEDPRVIYALNQVEAKGKIAAGRAQEILNG